MAKAAKLRIETVEPHNGVSPRIRPQDLRIFFNDVEMTHWRNFTLSAGVDKGCVVANFDVYIDELYVDADALMMLKDLAANRES